MGAICRRCQLIGLMQSMVSGLGLSLLGQTAVSGAVNANLESIWLRRTIAHDAAARCLYRDTFAAIYDLGCVGYSKYPSSSSRASVGM